MDSPNISVKYSDFKNAGVAVIFLHTEFPNPDDELRATEIDATNLQGSLESYGFMTELCRNYTTDRIEEKLKNLSRDIDHSENTALVIVMMSHGDKDKIIYTHDGEMEVDTLWKYFTGDRCPSLIGKPKLFFIQSCRGSMCDIGAILEEDGRRLNQAEEETSRKSQVAPIRRRIPAMADILVMFSSADGYYSYMDERGSWFIGLLYRKLNQCVQIAEGIDLIQILTSVNRDVAFLRGAYDSDDHESPYRKQMPVIMSMLTKSFNFKRIVQRP